MLEFNAMPAAQAAREYARRFGWPVHPKTATKRPMTAHGYDDATADIALIAAWWETWPEACIALACGGAGIVAVDADAKHAGPEHFAQLCAEKCVHVETLTAKSGGGGMHFYFTLDYATTIRGGSSKLGHGIDVICGRNSITLPPSTHASGRAYQWVNDAPMQAFPAVFVEMLQPPAPVEERAHISAEYGEYKRCIAYLRRMPDAVSGSGGHAATFRAAVEIWRFNLSPTQAWEAMRWWNAIKCRPKWGECELRHKLESAQKAVSDDLSIGIRNRELAAA